MTENMGKQIRAGRQRSSLTQEKLAETLGVTPQAVSKWERGESLPDIALLPELSAAMGLTMDELFESSAETHLRLIAYWQDYVEKYPDHSPAYLYLLDNLLADGRLTEAEEALTKLAALRQDFQIPCYRGLIEKARGRRSAAWETWNAMVANDPENWLVYLCRADCHAREADYPAAIADYRQAAALQPKPRYTDPWDSVAQLSRLSQDRAGEAEAYERIIDILQTDWGLGECETVQGYRENLKACR